MQYAKSEMVEIEYPFYIPYGSRATFPEIGDNTQNSVFVQKEIEEFSTHFTPRRNLTNPGIAVITHRVHDQQLTSLTPFF